MGPWCAVGRRCLELCTALGSLYRYRDGGLLRGTGVQGQQLLLQTVLVAWRSSSQLKNLIRPYNKIYSIPFNSIQLDYNDPTTPESIEIKITKKHQSLSV